MARQSGNFISNHGHAIMLAGFAIVAAGSFIMIQIVQNGQEKNPLLWVVVALGIGVYLTGRIGVAMDRSRRRNIERTTLQDSPAEDERGEDVVDLSEDSKKDQR